MAPRRLDPTVPRDLETIVLKAMDKEPVRRYATVRELAEDLGRFLEDKTILARRATAAQRAAKWTRRHRAVVAVAGAVAFAALAIATPLLWWEQQNTARLYHDLHLAFGQADLGFEQMMRLSDELAIKGMARFAEPSRSPRATETRLEYYRHAVEFYERLVREPQIGKPMKALAYRRLGFARLMGLQDPRAGGDLERSLALYEELLAGTPRDPEVQDAIADVLLNLGMVHLTSRKIALATNSFRRATSLDEELAAQFPDDPRFIEQLTGRRLQVAAWLESFGWRPQAEQERRELLAWYDKQAAGASRPSAHAHGLAAAYHDMARSLARMSRTREQQEALRGGLKLEPNAPALLNDLAWSLALSPAAPPRESAEAIELAQRAIAANPAERGSWRSLALAQLRAGHLPLAAEAASKAMGLQPDKGDASLQLILAMVAWRRGDKAGALDCYVRALEWSSKQPDWDPSVISRSVRKPSACLVGLRLPSAYRRSKRPCVIPGEVAGTLVVVLAQMVSPERGSNVIGKEIRRLAVLLDVDSFTGFVSAGMQRKSIRHRHRARIKENGPLIDDGQSTQDSRTMTEPRVRKQEV